MAKIKGSLDISKDLTTGGIISFTEQSSAPGTPLSGYIELYVNTDKILCIKDSNGIETQIAGNGYTKLPASTSSFMNTDTITVDHNRPYRPFIEVVDTDGNIITEGLNIVHTSITQFVITSNINITGEVIYI